MKPEVGGRVADIGGVEHASRLFCTALGRLSIAQHSEPRRAAGCSPRPLRFRSAPLSAIYRSHAADDVALGLVESLLRVGQTAGNIPPWC